MNEQDHAQNNQRRLWNTCKQANFSCVIIYSNQNTAPLTFNWQAHSIKDNSPYYHFSTRQIHLLQQAIFCSNPFSIKA